MKSKESKDLLPNKSVINQKKSSSLVIQTQLDNSFDNRWAEIKIEGKNIASRSNHIAVVFGHYLYIHGGYDVDRGLIADFHEMDIAQNCEQYVWKAANNTCEGKQIKLKGHSAVVYKEKLYLFGGEYQTDLSNNHIYCFDFVSKSWNKIPSKADIPKVDSHCAVVVENKMYVYGGYISDKAEYLLDILSFNFDTLAWEIVYKGSKNEKQPQGRASFAMVENNGNLILFGGTNGVKTLNDMWQFDLKVKKWDKIDNKQTPQPRRGHSMQKYENYIFMFGGIQDVTKQKNDIYIYQFGKSEWSKVHTTTNAVYDCSPTLKKESKKNKSPNAISPVRISPEKSDKIDNTMKKILIENKHKKFMQRKKELLKQFTEPPSEQSSKKRQLSPTTESMLKTLQTIGNQQSNNKELKQEIIYDETHRYIIGKKPCARDGQSVTIFNNMMYIFGGDRHLMAFNDLYQFDLAKGIKSLQLYKGH